MVSRSKNVEKVVRSIVSDETEQEAFFRALELGNHGVRAVVWLRGEQSVSAYSRSERRPPWLPQWIDVVAEPEKLGRLSQHERGEIYVLDLSSTFAVAPLEMLHSISGSSLRCILDVCAAPGGKGIIAWRYCNPELIIANEVIRKRTAQLIANYQRCAIDPAMVCSCDPGLLATLIPNSVDLAIVDAPCSGQSLALKGMAAPGAFHPATIAMNERRQRRILANSAKTVRAGGFLLYSTCTFSREENEDTIEWLCKKFPEFSPLEVPALAAYRSSLSAYPTYRLLPHHGYGAGAFVAVLRCSEDNQKSNDGFLRPETVTDTVWPVWKSRSVADNRT